MTIISTLVRIPPVRNGAGDLLPARVDVRLVRADGRSIVGLRPVSGDFVLERASASEIPGDGVDIPLTPTADIAAELGVATRYAVTTRIQGGLTRTDLIQVPRSDGVTAVALETLIAAAQIDGADLCAELIAAFEARIVALEANQLPAPGTPGRILLDNGSEWIASDTLPV